jgi:hypothetical protein
MTLVWLTYQSGMASIFCNSLDNRLFGGVIAKPLFATEQRAAPRRPQTGRGPCCRAVFAQPARSTFRATISALNVSPLVI